MIGINRVLVLAPHPDDEIIGCGVALKQIAELGAPARIVVITDGAAGLEPGADAQIRKAETRAGLARLGIHDCEFWDYEDGALPFGGGIVERYRSLVADFRPSHILLPHPAENHADHRALTRGFLAALESLWRGTLWFYETTQPCHPINHYEDATKALEHKLAALSNHRSQLQSFDFAAHCELLAQMRGLAAGLEAAEAYLVFEWDGSPQRFFVSEPLVSIVVRADDATLVAHALASIRQQTYPWIEIVLVWFGDAAAPAADLSTLPMIVIPGTKNRSANLNAGIQAAHGEYVGFLDEDDVFYVDHVSELVAELTAQPDIDIAFSGCRLVSCRRDGDTVSVQSEIDLLDHRYQPGRLLLGNYLTVHSTLLKSHVLRQVRFDPELEAYEDWDFFAHCEQLGFRFARADGIGCEYRLYPQPGEDASSMAAIHARKGYTRWSEIVRDRICRRMSPADLTRLDQFADRHKGPLEKAREQIESYATELAELKSLVAARAETFDWLHVAAQLDASLPESETAAIPHLVARNLGGPLISILVPVFNTDPRLLAILLQSILDQAYRRWQLIVMDDASTNEDTRRVLKNFARSRASDARVIVRARAENEGIVTASNDALALASGDLVAFVDHDDVLAEDALLHVAVAAMQRPDVKLIYTDSRMIDHVGNVLNTFSKPDWSPSTLLSYNYINHLTVIRRDLLLSLGGLRQSYAGSQDWDLLLRLRALLDDARVAHIPHFLYDWRATDTSVAYSMSNKPWAFEAAKRALGDAVASELQVPTEVGPNPYGLGYLVNWPGRHRPVTVVIPTHSNREGLRLCLKGLLEETEYPALTVLVIANRCGDPGMRADLTVWTQDPRVRVRDDPGPFNWAALMNRAIAQVESDAVLFMNDDVEILEADWLRKMLRYLDLAGIGAIGATLFYPDGSLQHGGIVTDSIWIASDIKGSLAPQEAAGIRDVSAVTGACLLTTRAVLDQAGGFDELFPLHYNDVDFCLALRHDGYRVIQAGDVRLKHHESATRGKLDDLRDPVWNAAVERMRRKWGTTLTERYRVTYQAAAATRILRMQA